MGRRAAPAMRKSGDRPAEAEFRLSREEPAMIRNASGLLAFCLFFSACLDAAEGNANIRGKVVDPSGAPVAGAQIALVNRVGVVARTTAAANGTFEVSAGDSADVNIVVAASGFGTRTLKPAEAATVRLEIAPQVSSVDVV